MVIFMTLADACVPDRATLRPSSLAVRLLIASAMAC
jgi:hypothetical protein